MKNKSVFLLLLLSSITLTASDWEWQFALGPWTLHPWISPAQRQAERMVSAEARRLLAPLLSAFTITHFEPSVVMSSRGFFVNAGCWRRLGAGRFALGISASYLDFSLPFSLEDERDFYFQGLPLARVLTSGQGQVDLHTFMMKLQGRWRAFQSGRIAVYSGLGLNMLRFSGNLFLPLAASVQSFLGTFTLNKSEEITLADLRKNDDDIPAWILSPALSASLHYRLGVTSRLFIEIDLSQGTFLAAGLAFAI
jgi:hypothetical protein